MVRAGQDGVQVGQLPVQPQEPDELGRRPVPDAPGHDRRAAGRPACRARTSETNCQDRGVGKARGLAAGSNWNSSAGRYRRKARTSGATPAATAHACQSSADTSRSRWTNRFSRGVISRWVPARSSARFEAATTRPPVGQLVLADPAVEGQLQAGGLDQRRRPGPARPGTARPSPPVGRKAGGHQTAVSPVEPGQAPQVDRVEQGGPDVDQVAGRGRRPPAGRGYDFPTPGGPHR